MKKITAVVLLALFSAQPAFAAQSLCSGKINKYYLFKSGDTLVINPSWHNSWITVCSVTTEWKGIKPEMCKFWFATLQASYLTGSDVTISYEQTDVPSTAACGSMATYNGAPSPRYIMARENP